MVNVYYKDWNQNLFIVKFGDIIEYEDDWVKVIIVPSNEFAAIRYNQGSYNKEDYKQVRFMLAKILNESVEIGEL